MLHSRIDKVALYLEFFGYPSYCLHLLLIYGHVAVKYLMDHIRMLKLADCVEPVRLVVVHRVIVLFKSNLFFMALNEG